MSTATILLIDDDETLIYLLSEYLNQANFRVISTSNGTAGLQMFTEKSPDLVILDVMMPGLDGWQVGEQLRRHPRSHHHAHSQGGGAG
jgi:CheY-like chemotaxis protein